MNESQKEALNRDEQVSTLTIPLLVLVQEPNPKIMIVIHPEIVNVDVGVEVEPPEQVATQVLDQLNQVVFEPCLVTPLPLPANELSTLSAKGIKAELVRYLGPYGIYELTQQRGDEGTTYITYGNRQDALRGVANIFDGTG